MHVVLIPSWYSNKENKVLGSFFKEQGIALKESGVDITVCYNEILPIYDFKKLNVLFKSPIYFEVEDGLETYRYKGFNYMLHSHRRFSMFSKRLEKLIELVIRKKGRIDVLHFHSCFWAGVCAPYIKQKFNIPYIITEHTSLNYSDKIKPSYINYIKDAYKNSNQMISVSNSLKREMNEIFNTDIKVIHNFIDEKKFVPIRIKKKDEMKIKIFSLAFLVKGKGFETLIHSCKILSDKGYDFELEIGGDGYLIDDLRQLAKDNNIDFKIKFLGLLSRDDVIKKMNECDFFVLASEYETFGVVYIEALSLGKPVVGVKNGGAEEIITDQVGVLLDELNSFELALAMEKVIKNLDLYDKVKIRRYFLDNFGKNKIIDELKDVYKNCLIIQG